MPSSLALHLVAAALGLSTTPEPAAPLSPRATIGHYNGNLGINTPQWSLIHGDVPPAVLAGAPPAPVAFGPLIGTPANAKAVGGQTWGPTLNIGTCVTGIGAGIVYLRTTAINGPNLSLGLCTSELLMGGPTLAQLTVPHNGSTLQVPAQPVPLAAIGSTWVSQALVRGTVAGQELSSAIYGTVDACF